MSSHFAYWSSSDVSLFIMRALHHHDVYFGAKPPPKVASKDVLSAPMSPTAQEGLGASEGGSLQQLTSARKSELSVLSLPSSPIDRDLLSPYSQKSSSKSSSVVRGKADPEDWW